MAKALLHEYLFDQLLQAWGQFQVYEALAQGIIGRENRNWRPNVVVDGRTLIDGYQRHFDAPPPSPFRDVVPCPPSNM